MKTNNLSVSGLTSFGRRDEVIVDDVRFLDNTLRSFYEYGYDEIRVYNGSHNQVFVWVENEDEVYAYTEEEWFAWFEANGNHDEVDGWQDAESWFCDMLRCHMFM